MNKIKAMIERVKAGQSAKAVLDEMGQYGYKGSREDLMNDPRAKAIIAHLAKNGPTKKEDIFKLHGGKGGGPKDWMWNFYHTGLVVYNATTGEYSLTSAGVEIAQKEGFHISQETMHAVPDADALIGGKLDIKLPPSKGGEGTPRSHAGSKKELDYTQLDTKSELESINMATHDVHSTSKVAKAYEERKEAHDGGTIRVVVAAEKALGKALDTKTVSIGGKKYNVTELTNQEKQAITKFIEHRLNQHGVRPTNILVHDSDGDDVPVDISIGRVIVLQKPKTITTGYVMGPKGEPIPKIEVTAGKGQMGWWDIERFPGKMKESTKAKIKGLLERLRK